MNTDLGGCRAIVCGSTQGIGRACAQELAELGASITLVARNEDKLKAVRDALPTPQQQEHHYLAADFQQPDFLKAKISEYVSNQSAVAILVNNTGGPAPDRPTKRRWTRFGGPSRCTCSATRFWCRRWCL